MGPLAAALPAIGAAVSAASTIAGGFATAANANYQAQIAKNNAIEAGYNAQYATEAGQEKAAVQSQKNAAQIGAIVTDQAANGVDVNSGSNADVVELQRGTNALDTLTILNNAALQAYGYKTQQTNFTAQANLDKQEAAEAPIGAALAAGGGLLSNSSAISTKWTSMFGGGGGGGPVSGNDDTVLNVASGDDDSVVGGG